MTSALGIVAELSIYPVKGFRRVPLQSSKVELRGLENDRRFLVVDENWEFMTQRNYGELATLSATIRSGQITLVSPSGNEFSVQLQVLPDIRHQVLIWKDYVDAIDLGDEVATWLSHELGKPCRLVFADSDSHRQIDLNYAEMGEQVSFADGYPCLITNEASLADLNQRLEIPIPMNRFRPNIVVSGFEAWSEDQWKGARIGDVEFKIVKPCARCRVPTIDQSTGVRTGEEPLRTLATFRTFNSKVMFGMNAIPIRLGSISVGDIVQVDV